MAITTTLSSTSTAATFTTVGSKTSALSATLQKLQGYIDRASMGGGTIVAMDQAEFKALKASLDQWTKDGIEYQSESGAFQLGSSLFTATVLAGVYNLNETALDSGRLGYLGGSFGKIESSTATNGNTTYFLNVETLNAWTNTLQARGDVLATKDPASTAASDINPQMEGNPNYTLSAGARKLAEVELSEVTYLQGVLDNLLSSFNGTPDGTLASLTYVDPDTREVITGKQLIARLASVDVLIGANKTKESGNTRGSAVVNDLNNPTVYEIGLETAQAWVAELQMSEVLAKTVLGQITNPSAEIDGRYLELVDPHSSKYSLDRARALYTAATRPRSLFGSQPAAAIDTEQAAFSSSVAAYVYRTGPGAIANPVQQLDPYVDAAGFAYDYGQQHIRVQLDVPADLGGFRSVLEAELGGNYTLAARHYVTGFAGVGARGELLSEEGLQGIFSLWKAKAEWTRTFVNTELLAAGPHNPLGWPHLPLSGGVRSQVGPYNQLARVLDQTLNSFNQQALNNAYDAYAIAAFDNRPGRWPGAHADVQHQNAFRTFRLQIGTVHDFMVGYASQSAAATKGQVVTSLQTLLDDSAINAQGIRPGLLGKPGAADTDFASMNYYQRKAATSNRVRSGLQTMRLWGSGVALASVFNAIFGATEDGISDRERGTRIFSAVAWTASLLQVPVGLLAGAAEKYSKGMEVRPQWTAWEVQRQTWIVQTGSEDGFVTPEPPKTVAAKSWQDWSDAATAAYQNQNLADGAAYRQYLATHPEPPRTYGEFLAAETKALHDNVPHDLTNWRAVDQTLDGLRPIGKRTILGRQFGNVPTTERLPSVVEHKLLDTVEVGRPNWIWEVEVGSKFRPSTNGYVFAKNGMFWLADITSLALNALRASNAMIGEKPDSVNAGFFSLAVCSDVLILSADGLGTFAVPGEAAARLAGSLMTAGYAVQTAISVAQQLYNGTVEYQRHPYSAEGRGAVAGAAVNSIIQIGALVGAVVLNPLFAVIPALLPDGQAAGRAIDALNKIKRLNSQGETARAAMLYECQYVVSTLDATPIINWFSGVYHSVHMKNWVAANVNDAWYQQVFQEGARADMVVGDPLERLIALQEQKKYIEEVELPHLSADIDAWGSLKNMSVDKWVLSSTGFELLEDTDANGAKVNQRLKLSYTPGPTPQNPSGGGMTQYSYSYAPLLKAPDDYHHVVADRESNDAVRERLEDYFYSAEQFVPVLQDEKTQLTATMAELDVGLDRIKKGLDKIDPESRADKLIRLALANQDVYRSVNDIVLRSEIIDMPVNAPSPQQATRGAQSGMARRIDGLAMYTVNLDERQDKATNPKPVPYETHVDPNTATTDEWNTYINHIGLQHRKGTTLESYDAVKIEERRLALAAVGITNIDDSLLQWVRFDSLDAKLEKMYGAQMDEDQWVFDTQLDAESVTQAYTIELAPGERQAGGNTKSDYYRIRRNAAEAEDANETLFPKQIRVELDQAASPSYDVTVEINTDHVTYIGGAGTDRVIVSSLVGLYVRGGSGGGVDGQEPVDEISFIGLDAGQVLNLAQFKDFETAAGSRFSDDVIGTGGADSFFSNGVDDVLLSKTGGVAAGRKSERIDLGRGADTALAIEGWASMGDDSDMLFVGANSAWIAARGMLDQLNEAIKAGNAVSGETPKPYLASEVAPVLLEAHGGEGLDYLQFRFADGLELVRQADGRYVASETSAYNSYGADGAVTVETGASRVTTFDGFETVTTSNLKDRITIDGEISVISALAGDDELTLNSGNVTAFLGEGANKVTVNGRAGTTIMSGNDAVALKEPIEPDAEGGFTSSMSHYDTIVLGANALDVFIYVTQGAAKIDATQFKGTLHIEVVGKAVADIVYGAAPFQVERHLDSLAKGSLLAAPGVSNPTKPQVMEVVTFPQHAGSLKRAIEATDEQSDLDVISTSTWTKVGSGADAQIMRNISAYAKWDPASVATNGYWNSGSFQIDNAYDYGSLSLIQLAEIEEDGEEDGGEDGEEGGNRKSYLLGNWIDPFQIDDPDHVFTGSEGVGDFLQGTDDIDTLEGLSGNDTYVINHKLDYVVEKPDAILGGRDKALVSSNWYMSANVEDAEVVGETGRAIHGNDSDNVILGNSGNDTLEGGGGADELGGGLGDDTYGVDAEDTVVELAGQGNDTIETRIDGYSLGNVQNVENLTLDGIKAISGSGDRFDNVVTGNLADNHLYGMAGNDTLKGGAGNDMLDGGTGLDRLEGGKGNDTYILGKVVVEVVSGPNNGASNLALFSLGDAGNPEEVDTVVETGDSDGGIDTVYSSLSDYTLTDHVENLTLVGTTGLEDLSGTGNSGDNTLVGNAGANVLRGKGGDDVLNGGAGADTMYGGEGNDTYVVDASGDVVSERNEQEQDEGGRDKVLSSVVAYTLGVDIEDLELTDAAESGTGNDGDNRITGNSGDNIIDGKGGADTMTGGAGNDTYTVDNLADLVVESGHPSGGVDTVVMRVDNYTMAAGVEKLIVEVNSSKATGNDLDNVMTGSSGGNYLIGNAGNDTLDGGRGMSGQQDDRSSDLLEGGAGDDTYYIDTAAWNNVGTEENPLYVEPGDLAVEQAGEGHDKVISSVDYRLDWNSRNLASDVEDLELTGAAIRGDGNQLDNFIRGNAQNNILKGNWGNDVLDGGLGADEMYGGAGNDTYRVNQVGDVVSELDENDVDVDSGGVDTVEADISFDLEQDVFGSLENLKLTGTAYSGAGTDQANELTGNDAANVLYGRAGDDTLNGGAGADTMYGGANNDTYWVDNASDRVSEMASDAVGGTGDAGGRDMVRSTVSFDLAGTQVDQGGVGVIEDLYLEDGAIAGWGNATGNTLFGNSRNNWLDGRGGADTMSGGAGDDTYVVDDAADLVYELGDAVISGPQGFVPGGEDTVESWVDDYALADNVENLKLKGTARKGTGNGGDNHLVGTAGADTLIGLAGDDVLDGGAGADRMEGGADDDTYIVDNLGDVVIDTSGAQDTVHVSVDGYTLADGVERLKALSGVQTAHGNDGKNTLIGNDEGNTLYGGADNDTLIGGGGNDTLHGEEGSDEYWLESADDRVVELVSDGAGQDTDTVHAGFTADLNVIDSGEGVEALVLEDTGDFDAWGNSKANSLTGNAGNNVLDGRGGADVMRGLGGDDTYKVDNGNDRVFEEADKGIDTVVASNVQGTYALNDNVENLQFTGSQKVAGTGNALANKITGNEGDNVLTGLDGDDELIGNGGNDQLDGGAGVDTMEGGQGDDSYWIDDVLDEVTEKDNEGVDTVYSSVSFTASYNAFTTVPGRGAIDNITLLDGAVEATGNTLANRLTGNAGGNQLFGMSGHDTLVGLGGHDTLNGGSGDDTMLGGEGDDTYMVDSLSDSVTELAGQGNDTVYSNFSVTLVEQGPAINAGEYSDIENAFLTDAALNPTVQASGTVTGNSGNNVLGGNRQANVLSGNGGDDKLYGLAGGDSLNGGEGNDTLDGGSGADTMTGGTGNDEYWVDDAGDAIQEGSGAAQGNDTVVTSLTTDLSEGMYANLENVRLIGSEAIDASGNAAANRLEGNEGNNVLDGKRGADTMVGGQGDDTYYVDSEQDKIEEGADVFTDFDGSTVTLQQGSDMVYSAIGYTLGNNLEGLTLLEGALGEGSGPWLSATGNELDNTLIGNSDSNILYGLVGNDFLDGAGGADAMAGGVGDDTYVVDNQDDVVQEEGGQGDDTVQTGITYALTDTVENLRQTGAASINGTGNNGKNIIEGNAGGNLLAGLAGDDVISGGAGNDSLLGGAGNDVLQGGSGDDTIDGGSEAPGPLGIADSGNDTASYASASSGVTVSLAITTAQNTIGAGIDTITGIENLQGSAYDDILMGDSRNNRLDGNGGNDTVSYEMATWGVDANLQTGHGYSFGNSDDSDRLINISNLKGSAFNDLLTGDGADNVFEGGAGHDVLNGGLGDDTASYAGAASGVTVSLALAGQQDTGGAGIDTLIGMESLRGSAYADHLSGNDGRNLIDGGAGADTMSGGADDDDYVVDNIDDVVMEDEAGGIDAVSSTVGWHLQDNVENLALDGVLDIDGTGNTLNNVMRGNVGKNFLDGGEGVDTVILSGAQADYTFMSANGVIYVVDHTPGRDGVDRWKNIERVVFAQSGETVDVGALKILNALSYIASYPDLISAFGADELRGIEHYVTYGLGEGRVVTFDALKYISSHADLMDAYGPDEAAGARHYIEYGRNQIAQGVRAISVEQTTQALPGGGSRPQNSSVARQIQMGLAGNDTLMGTDGNDGMFGMQGNDSLAGGAGDDGLSGGAGDDALDGGAGQDQLSGGDGDDTLDGGAGDDAMYGGAGNDTYMVDSAGDGVVETLEGSLGGTDTVLVGGDVADFDLSLAGRENIENATRLGDADAQLSGNRRDNLLIGGGGNDALAGMGGTDVLDGRAGVNTAVLAGQLTDYDFRSLGTTILVKGRAAQDGVGQAWVNMHKVRFLGSGQTYNLVLADDNEARQGVSSGALDIMIGSGSQDSILIGGSGENVFVVQRGSKKTTIVNDPNKTTDRLVFGEGLVASDARLALGSLDIYFSTGEEVHIENFDANNPLANPVVENFHFFNGETYTWAQLLARGFDLTGTEGADRINGTALVDRIKGLGGDDVLSGGAGNDVLDGGEGADTLIGGAGADTMNGGAGNDIYVVDSVGDAVNETVITVIPVVGIPVPLVETSDIGVGTGQSNNIVMVDAGGIDTVRSSINYKLAQSLFEKIENLVLTGVGNLDGTGNELANVITGNEGNNVLDGGMNADVLNGGAGSDTLIGGAGADTMNGGAGNDVYVVDNAGDVVDEEQLTAVGATVAGIPIAGMVYMDAGGVDKVQSEITYTLGKHVEDLTLTGAGNINGTGNAGNNTFRGNAGRNVLDGGAAGVDTVELSGGPADYTFMKAGGVIYAGDRVAGRDGLDQWKNVDKVTFLGTGQTLDIAALGIPSALDYIASYPDLAAAFGANEQAGANHYWNYGYGEGRTVSFDGLKYLAAHADLMAAFGADEALGAQHYLQYGRQEIAQGTRASSVQLITVSLPNGQSRQQIGMLPRAVQVGTSGNDSLGGTLGNDGLFGLEGDDTLLGGAGNDGLSGGAGSDVLDGGAGADQMAGGAGNDTYVVDNAGDVIVESVNQGIDTVEVLEGDYTLGANLENLTQTGASWYSATGNGLDNVIRGNEGWGRFEGRGGNDTLYGGAGRDELRGGTGNDRLAGGEGVDAYLFGRGDGADVIMDTEAPTSEDILQFDLTGAARVDFNQLWFSREQGTANLKISVMGTADEVKVLDWYVPDTSHRLDSIVAANGQGVQSSLIGADVARLVNAMAAMAPPASATSWSALSSQQQSQLQALGVWH